MNFRFAHYDPPMPKPEQMRIKSTRKQKKGIQLQCRPSNNPRKDRREFTKSKRRLSTSETNTEPALFSPAADDGVNRQVESEQATAIIDHYGVAQLDPFSVCPDGVTHPYVHEVLYHAIHKKWPNISPSPSAVTAIEPIHPVKRGWMECAISNPVAFYALFYAASQHLNYLNCGDGPATLAPTLRLSYKTKAIALINCELSSYRDKPLPDALLIAILSLGAHGNKPVSRYSTDTAHNQSPLASAQMLNFYGHIDQETAHMSALRTLLAHNKGVESIELPGLVGALQLGDVLHSTITDQAPTLAPRPSKLPHRIAAFVDSVQTYHLKPFFFLDETCATRLLETVIQARFLTAALEQFTSEEHCDIEMDDLVHARNLIHHKLISLPDASGLWGAGPALYDCIRLAMRVYSDLVFFPLPASTGVRVGLARKLRRALDCASLHPALWKGKIEALLWCSVLAGIASEEEQGKQRSGMREYMRSKVRQCARVLGCKTWEGKGGVETICGKIIWWKHVCSGRGKMVWDAVVKAD